MVGKLGIVVLMVAASIPAAAAGPGSISGTVKSTAGVPQMGAVVQVIAGGATALTVYTDANGRYRAHGLTPGIYEVKVSAPSFLPALRENVDLRGAASAIVNLTLTTLFEALQMMPARSAPADTDDDWKWTLRGGNRPVLRIFQGSVVTTASRRDHDELQGRLAFMAGSEGSGAEGAPQVSTNFVVERSLFSSGTLAFKGNVGYQGGTPAGVLRAAYRHQFANGSHPEVAVTVRRFATATTADRDAALEALALSVADGMTFANLVDLNFGGELQTIQYMGRVSAFRPFGSVDLHLSPNTVVQYRYASAEPTLRDEKGFDNAPADLSESGPRVTLVDGQAALERAHHHELSVSRRMGENNFQVAVFADRVRDIALAGIGHVTAASGDFMPDVYAGTFAYNGGELRTEGVHVIAEHHFTRELSATAVYAYGGVLTLAEQQVPIEAAHFVTERRHAVTAKLSGRVPGARTRWLASYQWTSGPSLTSVDAFDASPGRADPYVSVFLRQPLPELGFLPAQMEAVIDVRNLLAQGYLPLMGSDGQVVYLVEAPRSMRAGLAFTF